MPSVPMPRDLSEEAVATWVVNLYVNGATPSALARAVRALLREKVREAVCAGDVTDVLDEDRADAIVARVLGEEAPRA